MGMQLFAPLQSCLTILYQTVVVHMIGLLIKKSSSRILYAQRQSRFALQQHIESNNSQTASPREFNRLNFCLDIAIGGVSSKLMIIIKQFSSQRDIDKIYLLLTCYQC
jgi:hypothetical protein